MLGYGVWMSRPLDVAGEFGPASSLPSLNGYDALLQAQRQLLEANSSLVQHNFGAVHPVFKGDVLEGTVDTPQMRARWLAESKEGFATVDRALQLPFQLPVFRPKSEDDVRVAALTLRSLAKSLYAKSACQAEGGDHFGAAQSAIDAIQLGINMEVNSGVVDALSGMVCESYGRRALGTQIAYLSAPQAAQLARRLESILAKRPKYSQIMAGEKIAFAYGAEVQVRDGLQKSISQPDASNPNRYPAWQARLLLPLSNAITRLGIQSIHEGIDGVLPGADTPWPSRVVLTPASDDATGKLVAKLQGSRFFYERSKTMANQCLIRLALHAHRKATGAYPQKLEEIVPRYLTGVPADTFAAAPMRYATANNRYTLWSVGPDARDDGGRPLQDATKIKREARYLVRPNSTGDIVANISV